MNAQQPPRRAAAGSGRDEGNPSPAPTPVTTAHAAALADRVLATGSPEECGCGCGLVGVPDVVVVEGEANGKRLPPGPRIARADGREVAFFAMPGARLNVGGDR